MVNSATLMMTNHHQQQCELLSLTLTTITLTTITITTVTITTVTITTVTITLPAGIYSLCSVLSLDDYSYHQTRTC